MNKSEVDNLRTHEQRTSGPTRLNVPDQYFSSTFMKISFRQIFNCIFTLSLDNC
jgi:hypothetical protein